MPAAIDRHLDQVRTRIGRVGPREAAALAARGALLVDTRPEAQRRRFGTIPGALVIERNVLEWRLDPTSDHHHPALTGPDHPVVVLCQEGYASSLAVASLAGLGLTRVHDLDGGYAAWAAVGLPTQGVDVLAAG